jgi:hypothetical protein
VAQNPPPIRAFHSHRGEREVQQQQEEVVVHVSSGALRRAALASHPLKIFVRLQLTSGRNGVRAEMSTCRYAFVLLFIRNHQFRHGRRVVPIPAGSE